MKTKTIKKILDKKFQDFCDSITDDNVRKLVKDNSLISGGCIASLLLREKPNDYDIYFTNKKTVLAVANYYAELSEKRAPVVDVDVLDDQDAAFFKDHGIWGAGRVAIYCTADSQLGDTESDDDEVMDVLTGTEVIKEEPSTKYKLQYISPNAISLSHKVQLIIRFYGTPAEIHSNYDFVHATNYWISKNENKVSELVLNLPAVTSVLTKELVYIGSKYPLASIIRVKKFVRRGFDINAGQQLKMMYQVGQFDLNDIPTLEDQLTGVDVAYFMMLITALRSAQKTHAEDVTPFQMTDMYLFKLIDKIFS